MIPITIKVRYTCTLCATLDVVVTVPARGDEDVGKWLDQTAAYIGDDHRRRSPKCVARKMTNLKIPITGADKVGGPIIE